MNKSVSLSGPTKKVVENIKGLRNDSVCWNNLNCESSETVKNICNLILQNSAIDKNAENNDQKIDQLFSSLGNSFIKMSKLVKKMARVTAELKYISESNDYSNDTLSLTPQTIKKFCDNSDNLLYMFNKELNVKKSIIENLAKTDDKSQLMFLAATWTYQAFIDDDRKYFYIKTMFTEIGIDDE